MKFVLIALAALIVLLTTYVFDQLEKGYHPSFLTFLLGILIGLMIGIPLFRHLMKK